MPTTVPNSSGSSQTQASYIDFETVVTASPVSPKAGDTLTFTVTVTNVGTLDFPDPPTDVGTAFSITFSGEPAQWNDSGTWDSKSYTTPGGRALSGTVTFEDDDFNYDNFDGSQGDKWAVGETFIITFVCTVPSSLEASSQDFTAQKQSPLEDNLSTNDDYTLTVVIPGAGGVDTCDRNLNIDHNIDYDASVDQAVDFDVQVDQAIDFFVER